MTAFPLFDLTLLSNTDAQVRRNHCARLLEAASTYGFFRLVNHGIDDQKIDELFDWSRRFFELPESAKDVAKHPLRPFPHRGWSRVGQEKLSGISDYQKGERNPEMREDTKESFDQGSCTDPLYGNIWPTESDIPGFRSFMEDFYGLYYPVHMSLLQSLETCLELPPFRLQSLCDKDETELRLTHYPPVQVNDLQSGRRTRIAQHTDFGTLTLLFQDCTGGLEIELQGQPGTFVPIESQRKSEMIVNIGDTLQNWTNQLLRSANHQVTIPEHLRASSGQMLPARYSVAFFGKANRDASLRCLSELRHLRDPLNDEDITTWEYNSRMVQKTYPVYQVA